jgi:D-alanyl-D-alanine carboxypeptidase
MIDRRELIAGGLAWGVATATSAKAVYTTKRQAIEGIILPPDFNGALAYGRQGKLEHIRCIGLADVEGKRPVTPHTQFKWGSASKWLASATALRLVERNTLSLDAPITTYLPDFRRDTGDRVLIKHLLSNTSGITDLLVPAIKADRSLLNSTETPAAVLVKFGRGDLKFTPGAGWDYTPLNWVIVAAVLERITGKPLAELVRQTVLQPLRMTETGYAQVGQPTMPELAAAYGSVVPPVRKMTAVPAYLAGSGNTASTARDAVRAAHGIFHTGLLSAGSKRELTQLHWPDQEYALGGRVHPFSNEPWAWETGKVEGYRALIAHRLRQSETIVIFNTTDIAQSQIGGWAETIATA